MFGFRHAMLTGVVMMGMAGIAQAGPIRTANLDVISSAAIGSSSVGTVTLTQNGATEVNVGIVLALNTKFVNTGGPHTPFAFNLSLVPDSVSVIYPTGGLFFPNSAGGGNTPYGVYSYAIDYTGGNGGGDGFAGHLDFKVLRAAGISTTDFIANAGGFYFSADVLGPAGGTGAVASHELMTASVPEPASLALFATSLLGLALVRYRRRS